MLCLSPRMCANGKLPSPTSLVVAPPLFHPLSLAAPSIPAGTVRRFLERHGNRLDAVVFCLSDGPDVEAYRQLLSLYFPRSRAEELCARKLLPLDCGDENGEIVIDERRIRIKPGPSLPGVCNCVGFCCCFCGGWAEASSPDHPSH